ncbi:hypothetical protein [Bradyrhizobium sp. USDA 4350]
MDLHSRWVAHDTDDCTFEIDEYRNAEGHQMLLVHLRVHRWTAASCRRIKRDWALFRQAVRTPLFASPMTDDPKWERFVTMMGWRPFSKVLCRDGIERPLFIHTV